VLIIFILASGMAVGWLAQLIVKRNAPTNWTLALVAGVAGSFIGGDGLALRPSGIVGSLLGALVVTMAADRLPHSA
jgi:uncharacterized membrane protein YeaQ/YmgE (transglycosylase-associated protein family)